MSIKKTLDQSRKETTRSSKMREFNLENMSFGSSAFTFSGSSTFTLDFIKNTVVTIIKESIPNFNLTLIETPLSQLGADSLTIVEIILAIEDKLAGVKIPDDKISDRTTPNDLIYIIQNS